jgi:hypothetical protein
MIAIAFMIFVLLVAAGFIALLIDNRPRFEDQCLLCGHPRDEHELRLYDEGTQLERSVNCCTRENCICHG